MVFVHYKKYGMDFSSSFVHYRDVWHLINREAGVSELTIANEAGVSVDIGAVFSVMFPIKGVRNPTNYPEKEFDGIMCRQLPDTDYWVSRCGKLIVRTKRKGRFRVIKQNKLGKYLCVSLSTSGKAKTITVQVLVCTVYWGPCPGSTRLWNACHHDDLHRTNNADNLSWGMVCLHQLVARMKNNPETRLSIDVVMGIHFDILDGKMSGVEIAAKYGVVSQTVSLIALGRIYAVFTGRKKMPKCHEWSKTIEARTEPEPMVAAAQVTGE